MNNNNSNLSAIDYKTGTRLSSVERRARTNIKQLSHAAVRVRDMERTRVFYEDVLGLPMVSTLIADFDVVTKAPSNYVHCFFELADGSAIAFFQFEEGYRDAPAPRFTDPYERHLALRTETEDDVNQMLERAKAKGFDCFVVDHEWCLSLYLTDPDGEIIEITTHRAEADDVLNQPDAHESLRNWLASAAH